MQRVQILTTDFMMGLMPVRQNEVVLTSNLVADGLVDRNIGIIRPDAVVGQIYGESDDLDDLLGLNEAPKKKAPARKKGTYKTRVVKAE